MFYIPFYSTDSDSARKYSEQRRDNIHMTCALISGFFGISRTCNAVQQKHERDADFGTT